MKKKYTDQSYFKKVSPESVKNAVIKETVKEVLALAKKTSRKPVSSMRVLDVGSGWGEYAFEMEKYVKEVTAVEPYEKLYTKALKNKKLKKSKVDFHNVLIEDFKTKKKYDVVLSLTTIEHMPEVMDSFKNIDNLMNVGAIIYITAPNKLWPFEPHYGGLPFLGWLPLPLAGLYMRITGKGTSFEDCSYALTYSQTKKLLDHFNWKYSFVVPDPNAVYLGCGEDNKVNKIVKKTGINMIKKFPFMWTFSKGFIIVAQKTRNN